MTHDQLMSLRSAHSSFLSLSENMTLPYQIGTKGIVSTASGALLPIFLISLRMLRRTGCVLPVELFVRDSGEYDEHICADVLPSLGAHCVLLSDLIGASSTSQHSLQKVEKYQLKAFSILFSSFEDVFFLDADNLLLQDPTPLFSTSRSTSPFKDNGLLLWPDFWASSTSPLFYDLASLPMPPLTMQASVESGQLLVSKRRMRRELLMTAYYNMYGPEWYYPLLSQGAPGQGDKETFFAGAEAVRADKEWRGSIGGLAPGKIDWGEGGGRRKRRRDVAVEEKLQRRDEGRENEEGKGVYMVGRHCDTIGYYEDSTFVDGEEKKGKYHGVAMLQYDPIQDFALAKQAAETKKNEPEEKQEGEHTEESTPEVKRAPFAMHHNLPKPNPNVLFATPSSTDPTAGAAINANPSSDSQYRRLWGPLERTLDLFGRDAEKDMWEELAWSMCSVREAPGSASDIGVPKGFKFWKADSGVCAHVESYMREVFGTV